MHRGKVKYILLLASVVLLVLVHYGYASELKDINSSDSLARFIYNAAKDDYPVSNILKGIGTSETLRVPGLKIEIPVREVFASIALERFGDKLENKVFESDKQHHVREICSFRDSGGQVHRFSILILQNTQYETVEQFLRKQLKNDKN